jgi:hypothetical protein
MDAEEAVARDSQSYSGSSPRLAAWLEIVGERSAVNRTIADTKFDLIGC